jgi:hypothetical protein
MQAIWVVGNAEEIASIPVTVSKSFLTYGGDVYGNSTFTPNHFHYFDATDKCVAAKEFDNHANENTQ